MSKDYERQRIWIEKGIEFKSGAIKDPDDKELELHPEKDKTRLCTDCSTTITIRDDDGEIIAHYGQEFLEVKDTVRKVGLCDKCNQARILERDRKRKKKEREQLKQQDRSDCRHLAECLDDFPDTQDEMQREVCFDCEEYERP